jgi:transcriptional regulator with PAS, ATPase and Fis domain
MNLNKENAFIGATFVYTPKGKMSKIFELIEKYAPLSNPLLITGETGTGKEQIVKIIHALSKRPGKLVSVNLSAIPQDLIENELFGHVKGAFTGADTTTEGLIEKAEYGSLFLDEIGEIPLQHQIKLLRVLQDNEYEKIGSNKTIKSTARFIFATSKDLEKEMLEKRFREDLYYRISTFHIHLLSLRERKEDIPLLVEHFLWMIKQQYNKKLKIHPEVMQKFLEYDWPGNVRELENIINRVSITIEKQEITLNDLPEEFLRNMDIEHKIIEYQKKKKELQEYEKNLLKEIISYYKGNLYQASKKLNLSRGAIQYKIKKYNIKVSK